jgi:endo-1,4-beta-xylanase
LITRREWLRGAAATAAIAGVAGSEKIAWAKDDPAEITGAGSLKSHASARGLLTGAAVDIRVLRSDDNYRQTLADQYSILVGENCMKFGPTQPKPQEYFFDDADALMSFAQDHDIKVRGHNFVWHQAIPEWFAATVTKDNARQIMVDHIRTVGGRYKGKIHSWDVVNEAIWIKDGRPDGLRSSSPWFAMLGPDYLDLAYRTAREADPQALLTYNDYGIEYDTEEEEHKRVAVLALLKRMKAAGTPLDALGIQAHIDGASTNKFGKGLKELINGAHSLGLQVFITELDVKDDGLDEPDVAARDNKVAETYADFLKHALEGTTTKAVLTWGVSDAHTWLNRKRWQPKHPDREQRPLPFDSDYQPTRAFFALRESFDRASRR